MQNMAWILALLISPLTMAASTGEVFFSGKIIEEANCQVSVYLHELKLDCNSNLPATSKYRIISDTNLEYLDQKETVAVISFAYH